MTAATANEIASIDGEPKGIRMTMASLSAKPESASRFERQTLTDSQGRAVFHAKILAVPAPPSRDDETKVRFA